MKLFALFSTISWLVLLPVLTLRAADAAGAAAAIANQAGLAEFGRVQSLSYTFRVAGKGKEVARSWQWWPREDKVRFTSGTGEVTEYRRDDAARPEKIDRWFVNDQYWLLFPFHLVWDPGVTLETFEPSVELQAAAGETVSGLRVSYDAATGYTPGDIYDLFYNEQHRIVRWIFRRGGGPAKGTGVSWAGYETFGPLTLATEHQGEGGFRLWFTGVSVEVAKEN